MTSSCRIEHYVGHTIPQPMYKLAIQSLLVLSGAALFAIAAQIKIYLPLSPVPFTAQTLVVFLLAGTLGKKLGTLSALAYLALGFLGLPVFAGGNGGFNPASMSFGYLWGFVGAAWIMGHFASKGYNKNLVGISISLLLANTLIYGLGILWMGLIAGFDKPLLAWGLFPFLISDALKITVAFCLVGSCRRLIYSPKD
jgi:biotin transport system substrate-specific component